MELYWWECKIDMPRPQVTVGGWLPALGRVAAGGDARVGGGWRDGIACVGGGSGGCTFLRQVRGQSHATPSAACETRGVGSALREVCGCELMVHGEVSEATWEASSDGRALA